MCQDLLEVERKLDWPMMRAMVEIGDVLPRVQCSAGASTRLPPFLNGVLIISIRVGIANTQYSLAARFPAKCGNSKEPATLPATSTLVKIFPALTRMMSERSASASRILPAREADGSGNRREGHIQTITWLMCLFGGMTWRWAR